MAFLLHHQVLDAASEARQTALVLHGALGSGQNFRSFAKQLSRSLPHVQFVLVDLRNHGDSVPAPPPHTLGACALDLLSLCSHLKNEGRPTVTTVIGHSFGGKVALELLRQVQTQPSPQIDIRHVCVLDSNPGPQAVTEDNEVLRVLSAVESIPMPVAKRADVVASVTARGLSSGLAWWMTTNLRASGTAYRWAFDTQAIRLLLGDYFSIDLWPLLERHVVTPTSPGCITLIVAEHSDRVDPSMRARANKLEVPGRLQVRVLADAGHWLHVDNPQGLLELLVQTLTH